MRRADKGWKGYFHSVSSRPLLFNSITIRTTAFAYGQELLWGHAFGKDVGLLEKSIDFDKFDSGALTDMGFEEEIFDRGMLGSRGHLDGFGGGDSAIIVLKHGGLDGDFIASL